LGGLALYLVAFPAAAIRLYLFRRSRCHQRFASFLGDLPFGLPSQRACAHCGLPTSESRIS
jgi:hypothetical protein